MKHIIKALLIISIFFAGCKKDDSNSDSNDDNNYDDYIDIYTSLQGLTDSSAQIQGYLQYFDNVIVNKRGICLSTSPTPTISNSDTTVANVAGTGAFISNFYNLTSGTTYYARAYAITPSSIQYGNEINFTTNANLPIITTTAISSITINNATSGGDITYTGNGVITDRGIDYSTFSSLGTQVTRLSAGTGGGTFSLNLTNLNAGTIYYVRAYATNAAGTAYGAILSFTTSPSPFTIGQAYQGGKIFYIDNTGLHGLIVTTIDISYNSAYGLANVYYAANGTGQQNTANIVNAIGAGNYAAYLCDTLVLNGYSDWFLPSYNELHQVWVHRNQIGFSGPAYVYWSSTEYTGAISLAYVEDFGAGLNGVVSVTQTHVVRAVRAF